MENIIIETRKLFDNHKYSTATRKINNESLSIKTQKELSFLYYREAEGLIGKENRKRLIFDLLEEAIKLNPELYGALEMLGNIYYEDAINSDNSKTRIKLLEKAKKQYEAAINSFSNIDDFGKRRRKAYNRISNELKNINDELAKYVKPIVDNKTKNVKAFGGTYTDAENCIIRNQFSAARKIINDLMNVDDASNVDEVKSLENLNLLLKYDLAINNFLDAEMDIENILNIGEIDVTTAIKLCKLCIRAERYDVTYYILKYYYKKYPKSLELIQEIIIFYIVTKNYEHALYLLNKYLYDFGNNREYYEFIKQAEYYLKTVLGFTQDTPSTYYEQQIKDVLEDKYTKAACKRHLENRIDFIIDRSDTLKPVYTFSKKSAPYQFDILYKNITERIKNMIPDERGIIDVYTVKFVSKYRNGKPNFIAKNYGINTCMFRVETISNTKNVINIVPAGSECKESEKIKKMS